MSSQRDAGKSSPAFYAGKVALGTFVCACLLSANSQFFLSQITIPWISMILLVTVILVGILFDIIGVAATAAQEAPLHSRASCKLRGASDALRLVRNADKVSNFCCDVVGDICGTLSGGIGASIVFVLPWGDDPQYSWMITALMSGVVAALTVGGKSFSKTFAIYNSDQIIFRVGIILSLKSRLGRRQDKQEGKKSLKKIKQEKPEKQAAK